MATAYGSLVLLALAMQCAGFNMAKNNT